MSIYCIDTKGKEKNTMMDLWDEVIHQIENDLEDRDTTALYEMLQRVPKDVLIAYLPEEREFIVSEN